MKAHKLLEHGIWTDAAQDAEININKLLSKN